jgi:hypothetical protein
MENIYTINLSTEIEVNWMGTTEKKRIEIVIRAVQVSSNEFEVTSETLVECDSQFAMSALPHMEKKFVEFEEELLIRIKDRIILERLKRIFKDSDVQIVSMSDLCDKDDKSHLL